MGIKDIYYSLEDKWYKFWDKIDSKVPVYGVIDKVDAVVPSFALFLIIVLFIILFVGATFYFSNQASSATFKITGSDGTKVIDSVINLNLMKDGVITETLTKRTNSEGVVTFGDLLYGQEVNLVIDLSKGTFNDTFIVNETGFFQEITLQKKINLTPIKRKVFFRDALGMTVIEPTQISFFCENSSVTPTPTNGTSTNGMIEITEPLNCGKLYGRITSPEYEQKQYYIDSTTFELFLVPYEPPLVRLKISIRNNGFAVSGTTFNIRLSGNNDYFRTVSSSVTEIEVLPGTYQLSVADPSNNYGIVSRAITINADKEEFVDVTKTVKAVVRVNVVDDTTGSRIEKAIVALKDSQEREMTKSYTDANGHAEFALTDAGDYFVSTKKTGDLNGGYYAKTVPLTNLTSDANITMALEKITLANAGRVTVRVTDQDGEPVHNAKIMLKYASNDAIVELNETKNYAISDINGYVSFLAGKVEGQVYASAYKFPFSGISQTKAISLDRENEFVIQMTIGTTTVKINAVDETGETIDGEAKLYTIDGLEASGLMSVEDGKAQATIKAGKLVYLKIENNTHEDYYSEPRFLWPDQTETFNIVMKTTITEPSVDFIGIFNDNGQAVSTMSAGSKYYALMEIQADEKYDELLMHFRAGKEGLLENDYIEIESVEAAGIASEVRGTSYTEDYAYDSGNLTSSIAKWTTVEWNNFGSGTMRARVNFKIKADTPANKELQFFWRGKFDETKKPTSTASEELYDDTYSTNTYFVGVEATCTTDFCIMNEWLYDIEDDLYLASPFIIKQARQYTYHYQVVNNSQTDYGVNKKKIAISIENISQDNEGAKIVNYIIKDPGKEVAGEAITQISDSEINTFEKNTAIDVTLTLEGNNIGNNIIETRLKSDGTIVFTEQETFSVPQETPLNVSLDRTFIPALINTPIQVDVTDNQGEPLIDATVRVYAKEPGFTEHEVDEGITNRLGTATVNSSAHFPNTLVIVEVSKAGFSRQRIALIVTDQVIAFNPSQINTQLNTLDKREAIEEVEVGNVSGKKLELLSINNDTVFEGIINEGALNAYFEGLRGQIIEAEGTTALDLIRIKLANNITEETLLEPIDITGQLIISFRVEGTNVIYDALLPLHLNVGSGASTESSCLILNNATQTKTTQQGRVIFNFELLNACETENGTGVTIEQLDVSSTAVEGMADISLMSSTSTESGRAALDGTKRKLYGNVGPGEKLFGTVTYAPSAEVVGTTVSLPITIEGRFQGDVISTTPSSLNYTVNVLNLKDCMSISSSAAPVAFDGTTTVTIDATSCLGQKIDVHVCRQNDGCSGGAEGKVSLSKRVFNLENSSETIDVYGPTLPGTYGISVWARVQGANSFNYIGEVPVSFREQTTKFFALSKTEINIIGNGQEDTVLLTNRMLQQNVRVKADNCVWGVQDPEVNWLQVIGGAALGAQLGSMIGSSFERGLGGSGNKDKDDDDTEPGTSPGGGTAEGDSETPTIADLTARQVELQGQSTLTPAEAAELDSIAGILSTQSTYMGPLDVAFDSILTPGESMTVAIDTHLANEYATITYAESGEYYTVTAHGFSQNYTSLDAWTIAGDLAISHSSWGVTDYIGNWAANSWGALWRLPVNVGIGIYNNTIEVPLADAGNEIPYWTIADTAPFIEKKVSFSGPIIDNTLPRLSFGWIGGSLTLLGAVAGGAAACLMQDVDCHDTSQIATMQDFTILLQGEELQVSSPDGTSSITRTIPSDAGALGFSLGGVTPSWDFTNSDYSNVENVGIRFANTGINEALPKYGVLTINANTHRHGQMLTLDPTATEGTTLSDFDVLCTNANFGRYWIGGEDEAGKCSGVTTGTYSQKYHVRVISGEPTEQEAYIDKANSCYNGVLTGATGPEAVPRIKLDWDWDDIDIDACDYGNNNYVYCDMTQFNITLVKKLAALNEFFSLNQNINCPEDPILAEALTDFSSINSVTELVSDGYFGITNISVSVIDNEATATLTVDNRTSAALETQVSAVWKGSGSPINDISPIQTFPTGESTITFTASTPVYDDVYYFSAVANGPGGNMRTLTRVFLNRPTNLDCWAQPTTRAIGGIPSIMYFLADTENITWTAEITNATDLYNTINFGSYVMRDSFSDDFLHDFKDYYLNQVFQISDPTERQLLEKMNTNTYNMIKRFSSQVDFEAGLYDVWLNIDFGEDFTIVNDRNDTTIEASLLLIRVPTENSPLYKIPFNGEIGQVGGRNGYGAEYTNTTDDELSIDGTITTFESGTSNGVVTVTTDIEKSLEKLTSSVGTRGQLAIISQNGLTADMTFSPNYATPVIAKATVSGTNGRLSYNVERNFQSQITGSNLTYWTGAGRSKDFFGTNAVEVYNETPDYLLQSGDEYGFTWENVSHSGTMYLKTVFYTPVDSSYVLLASNNNGLFWTPNNEFTGQVELIGIDGMQFNSEGNYFSSLQDLLDMVANNEVCISNDGSTTSFWWNPRVIETMPGSNNSLENKELEIAGTS